MDSFWSDIELYDEYKGYTYQYPITIIPNKKDRVYYKEDIDRVRTDIKDVFPYVQFYRDGQYELKKDGTLHWHGIMLSKVRLYFKKFHFEMRPFTIGFRLFLRMKMDYKWFGYLIKTGKPNDEVIIEHLCLHNLLITDSE